MKEYIKITSRRDLNAILYYKDGNRRIYHREGNKPAKIISYRKYLSCYYYENSRFITDVINKIE
jgi:hypothetical protein